MNHLAIVEKLKELKNEKCVEQDNRLRLYIDEYYLEDIPKDKNREDEQNKSSEDDEFVVDFTI